MYDDPPFDKAKTMAMLRAKAATGATVEFSGGNDEGGVTQITLTVALANGEKEQRDFPVYTPGGYRSNGKGGWENISPPTNEDEELGQMLAAPVDEAYGSFAGDFYVEGAVIFDVEADTVKMEKSESVMQDSESELYL